MSDDRTDSDVSDRPAGLECPQCGCRHFHVVYTRAFRPGQIIRRRECRHCGRRMTTTEEEISDGRIDGAR